MNNNNFIAYEYKKITVKRDSEELYVDCMQHFGWILTDEDSYDFVFIPIKVFDDGDVVTLKFKRDRHLTNRQEINKLERKCEEALEAINKMEKKDQAVTMGVSLGTGIIGTGFLGLAAYCFISSNIILGVLFSVIGFIGWGIGFLTNYKLGDKKAKQTETQKQKQLDDVYKYCEQAHALLA